MVHCRGQNGPNAEYFQLHFSSLSLKQGCSFLVLYIVVCTSISLSPDSTIRVCLLHTISWRAKKEICGHDLQHFMFHCVVLIAEVRAHLFSEIVANLA